jgi:hypothetical protein
MVADDHTHDRRPARPPFSSASARDIDKALMLSACNKRPLEDRATIQYTVPTMTLSSELYSALRQNIEDEFAARKRELEEQRRQAILALNEAWPKMGGSEEDLASLASVGGVATGRSSGVAGVAVVRAPRGGAPTPNGEPGRTIRRSVIEAEIEDVLSDEEIVVVTQTDIKDRILAKYPDAKVHSLRSAISHYLSELAKRGQLELVEKGKAGRPSKYRKNKEVEVRPLV